jgi:hypothetical protein
LPADRPYQGLGRSCGNGCFYEPVAGQIMGEQRFHFAAQLFIAGAGAVEQRGPFRLR